MVEQIGFVSHFWGSTGPPRVKLGSFRILGRIQKSESRIQERDALRQAQDGETPRAFYLMVALWARFVTPPVFGVALSLILRCIIPHFGRNASFFGRNESLVVGL